MPPPIDRAAQKEAVKEAIKEWMNEQFATFGRYTFWGVMAAAFAGLVYLALIGAGWHK